MKVIHDEGQNVSIHCWADRIDRPSLDRLKRVARSSRLAAPIAVMPDVHLAGEVCVGTVLVAKDCVLPTAIGEDLGCGMCSQSLELDAGTFSRADLEHIVAAILERVPVGRRTHRQAQEVPAELFKIELSSRSLQHKKDWLGARHIGTLGGGNHFIELQRDTAGRLWITVHSGSRGIGAAIASHHASGARTCDRDLPFIETGTLACDAFLADLNWALLFAAANRRRMLEETCAIISAYTHGQHPCQPQFDVPHNLISMESHGGRDVIVHRKGAMPAHAGQRGIIPGSMGTASYIVEGLGNAASYASCSHGAGRRLSRGEARRQITIDDLRRQMRSVVYPSGFHLEAALVEEAPNAYKDIKEVLEQQKELVRPLLRLEPLAVIKG